MRMKYIKKGVTIHLETQHEMNMLSDILECSRTMIPLEEWLKIHHFDNPRYQNDVKNFINQLFDIL